jgi:hypothetical protein
MNKQRIYDAMLIKAFRADINMSTLRSWLKPYDIEISDGTYERCPESFYGLLRVQVMVGQHMRNLADRLWNTEKTDDIKTLDLMDKFNFSKQSYKMQSEINSTNRKSRNDRKAAGFFKAAKEGYLKNNQWNVVK